MDIPLLCDVDAEESLLGGVIIQEGIPPEVLHYSIVPKDFYIIRNQWVWSAVLELDKFKRLNILTLADLLHERKKLVEIGGPARLTTFVIRCYDSCDIERDAILIKELAERRFALRVANRLAQLIYTLNEPFSLDDIVIKLYKSRLQTEQNS
jgi:replicative DNA helicase